MLNICHFHYNFPLWLCLLIAQTAYGQRNYYLSADGNDRADGKTPRTAWRSLERLQKVRLMPGDTVFFRCDDVFVGSLTLRGSGTESRPIVLTSYGQGELPLISGGIQITDWQPAGNNRLTASVALPVKDFYLNGRWQQPARFPNSGFLRVDSCAGKNWLYSRQLTQPDGYWEGATIRIRPIDWVYETRRVATYRNGAITIGKQNRYPIEKGFEDRCSNGETIIYQLQKGYGFYLESPLALDTAGEWAWQNRTLTVQQAEGQNLNNLQARAVVHEAALNIPLRAQHIRISKLAFGYYEKAGIYADPHVRHISIENCRFFNIHQVGIWLDSASQNCRIVGNQLHDILGRGISASEAKFLTISDNHLHRIGLQPGQGWTGVNGASAIIIHNVERTNMSDTTFAHNNRVFRNRIDSCGYNGIRIDGHHNVIEYNRIEFCSLTLNDAANLYCYAKLPGVTYKSVFRNNLVRYTVGNSQATPNNPNMAFGIYLDNNAHDITVENNVVISAGMGGILVNDASFNNIIKNNVVFDCHKGLVFSEWANVGQVYGCMVEGNTVAALQPKQQVFNLTNWIAPYLEISKIRNNTYYHARSSTPFHIVTKQIPEPVHLDLSFYQWQRITGEEGSRTVTPAESWAAGCMPVLLVNDTLDEKTVSVSEGHLTLTGEPAASSYVLPPYGAVILLKKTSEKQ